MRGPKNLIYRNSLGQEAVFDNETLYLESIDMIGTPGIHTVETLAFADGQQTIAHQLGAKTIPCSFAIKCVENVEWLKRRLTQIFSPLLSGTMEVITQFDRYEIDCYPLNIPTFKMAENDGVYRFDVDFIADYPYWRVGDKKHISVPPGSGFTPLVSDCPFDIAPEAIIPGNAASSETFYNVYFTINGKGLYLYGTAGGTNRTFPIKINTLDYSITNANTGENCNKFINANYNVDELRIKYGNNKLQFAWHGGSSTEGAEVHYYKLSMGEM